MKINWKMIAFSGDPEWGEKRADVPSAGPTDGRKSRVLLLTFDFLTQDF